MGSGQSYKGKLAIITGGASGLGLALADHLAALDARPILIDTSPSDAPYPLEIADVADADALAEAITRIIAAHGSIDLVIANAAIDLTGEAHTFTSAEWHQIIETNLIGAANLVAHVYPGMVARKAGQIIFIASGAGLIGFPLGAPYTASKAGIIGMAKALRAEAKRFNVRVNVACPPVLDTPLLENGKAKLGINRAAFIASLQAKPMPAPAAAKRLLRAAQADRFLIIFPFKLRLGHLLASLFPSIGEKMLAGILTKFDRHGRSNPN